MLITTVQMTSASEHDTQMEMNTLNMNTDISLTGESQKNISDLTGKN